jgi:predicted protein tyrosine phosphatase
VNILFVCSRNKWRSATAETIYQNHPDHQYMDEELIEELNAKVADYL